MSSSFTIPTKQKALIIPEKQAAFAVVEIDVPNPGRGELLIRAEAVGLNIADAYIQAMDIFGGKYPCVIGFEAAGTVVKVGEDVLGFSVGDRVLHGEGLAGKGTFKQYTCIDPTVIHAAKIPSNLSFDQAATIPLCLNTAAVGLYAPQGQPGGAGLIPPWEPEGRGKYAGQPILIFGGSSTVGQQAIQLAKLSGFSPIITTASLKNTEYMKTFGATHIIDRNTPLESLSTAIQDITTVPLKLIFDAIPTPELQNASYDLLASGGTVVVATPRLAIDAGRITPDKKVVTVIASQIWEEGLNLGTDLYKNLTSYLASGAIKPNNIEVLSGGLAGIPAGLKRLMENSVSTCKLIGRPQETA